MTNNIIEFKQKLSPHDIKVWNFSQDIDELITLSVLDGLSPVEVCVLLANRLGEATKAAYEIDEAKVFSSYDLFLEYVLNHCKEKE